MTLQMLTPLPPAGTMAAELVGDAIFSDDHLRGLQDLSLQPGFIRKGAESLSFLSAGYPQHVLDISRKPWIKPKVGQIAAAIVAMPLKWASHSPLHQHFDDDQGYGFTGFDRFLPTIAQRLAASLGMVTSKTSMEIPQWRPLVDKARQDICDILVRFPVLMHPSIQVQRASGGKNITDMLPLSISLKKSAFAVLPCQSMGYDRDTLTAFARHPCVEGTLHVPMTSSLLSRSMLRDHFLGQAVASPLAEWSSSNIDFAMSCGELNGYRKPDRRKRQWNPFLDPASAAHDPKTHERNRSAFCDFIMNIARGRSLNPANALKSPDIQRLAQDPWMRQSVFPSMLERRAFLCLDGHKTAERCFLILRELDIETDPEKASVLLFQACCKHLEDPTNPDHAPSIFGGSYAQFLQALIDKLESPSVLRHEMARLGQVIPYRWQDLLAPHENAQIMSEAIAAGVLEAPSAETASPARRRARI